MIGWLAFGDLVLGVLLMRALLLWGRPADSGDQVDGEADQ